MPISVVEQLPDPYRHRDRILLGLLFVLGLRRAEIAGLRVAEAQLAERRLMITGKGAQEPEPITMPASLAEQINAYLEVCGNPPPDAPLLSSGDPAGKGGGGLSANGVYRRVRRLADSPRLLRFRR